MRSLACKICSALVIGLVVLLWILPGFAEEETKSGLFTYVIKGNGTAKITGFDWEQNGNNDLYIPRMLDGYTVTEIGNEAFAIEEYWDYKSMDKIAAILPDTITAIGERAFFSCVHIGTINIPASVQLIGDGAFSHTEMKCSVDTNNEYFATIENVLYEKKTKKLLFCPRRVISLSNKAQLVIPDGIELIGANAFYDAIQSELLGKFEVLVLPNTIKEIGDYAFYGCDLKMFSIPDSVTKIGDYAFSNCKFVSPECETPAKSGLYLPASVKQLGEGAFESYKGFVDFIDLQDTSIETIPSKAFSNIDILMAVYLPSSLTAIEDEAFANTDLGLGINMYDGIETIGTNSFNGSELPDVITLPSTVKTIGEGAFNNTEGLTTLVLPSGTSSIGMDLCDRTQVTLQVEPGSYAAIWASENGYPTTGAGGDDTSWLTE